MNRNINFNLNYDQPIKISDDVYWVGFYDTESNLHCNPYLVIDNGEAVLIDSGSRPHFPTVLMKILQTGTSPNQIKALIYHHYDPDLCGNIPSFEDIIGADNLQLISAKENMSYIRHYSVSFPLITLEELGFRYSFTSGRTLEFIMTPYAHCAGSFITYDTKTRILFTSDLIGSYSKEWDLYLSLDDNCYTCSDYEKCPNMKDYCPFPDILKFHQRVFPSSIVLRHAVDILKKTDFRLLAPQHGSIVSNRKDGNFLLDTLASLENVGIDRFVTSEKC